MSKEQVKKELTESEKVWEYLKGKNIAMFSLPDQTVEKYCTPIFADPSKLLLVPKATSVLPALETAFVKEFTFEVADKYIVVHRVK
jgi:hypothetical protein